MRGRRHPAPVYLSEYGDPHLGGGDSPARLGRRGRQEGHLEALYEVDTVDRGLNEPSATDDVPERRSDSPPPGGITPPDR